jgi:hypothetical protein
VDGRVGGTVRPVEYRPLTTVPGLLSVFVAAISSRPFSLPAETEMFTFELTSSEEQKKLWVAPPLSGSPGTDVMIFFQISPKISAKIGVFYSIQS